MQHNEPENTSTQPSSADQNHAPATLLPAVLARLGLQSPATTQSDSATRQDTELPTPPWYTRAAAIRELAKLGSQAPLAPLLAAIDDEHESVRAVAVHALSELGSRAPIERILAALDDPSWQVREVAVLTLPKLDARLASAALLQAQRDPASPVREAALQEANLTAEPASPAKASSSLLAAGQPHTSIQTDQNDPSQHTALPAMQQEPTQRSTARPTKPPVAPYTYSFLEEDEEEDEPTPRRLSRFGALARTLVAVLVVAILLGGFFLLFSSHRGGTGARITPTAAWSAILSPNPGSAQNTLQGVAALSANEAWAVGYSANRNSNSQQALILHWNGSQWTIVPSPNPSSAQNSLQAVASIATNDVWAVGSSSTNTTSYTLIEHWNGARWSVVPSPNPGASGNDLNAITALSPNDIWAVGLSTTTTPSNSPGSTCVSAPPIQCSTGVSLQHTLIEHWNGVRWSVIPSPNTNVSLNILTGVTAITADDIWAVGLSSGASVSASQTLIEHWNGARWSIVPSPNPGNTSNILDAVSAINSQDVWGVGSQDNGAGLQSLILHWDGFQWTAVKTSSPATMTMDLFAVTAISANNIWAVGDSDNNTVRHTLTMHWDGSQWRTVPSPNQGANNNSLLAITHIPNSSKLLAIGSYNLGNIGNTDLSSSLIELYS